MDMNNIIDSLREDIIKSTCEIVKIKSLLDTPKEGMPFGEGVAKSLDYAIKLSEELGFKAVNLDGYVAYAEYGEGEDYVAALGHLDIVPEGDGWKYPPYAAEIHDGKIWGRGTTDDKGPTIAALYGLKAMKEAGLKPSKKIRIIFGASEETGGPDLEYYLSKEKPPVAAFTPDANYPIINGEKGLTSFHLVKDFSKKCCCDYRIKSIKGGSAGNMVPDYCEAIIETNKAEVIKEKLNKFIEDTKFEMSMEEADNKVTIKSVGFSAHGSTPQLGKNAIMQLMAFLGELDLGCCEIKSYIDFMNEHIGFDCYGEKFGIFLEDEVSGKLSFNFGKIDLNEEKAVATLNLRYPVTFKLEDMMTPFNKTIEGTGFRVENFGGQEPLYFAPEHPLIKTLQKVYTEQTGEEATLVSIGGGTYAKEMPNTVAFGPMFPGDPDVVHQPNEYIEVEKLIKNAKIYGHALYELAK
ncbi:succinyl-diaminopimelate desuccinylase [Clostridium collagenovorans DSM 3089]|uniref:Succinyl-diaminopimelate desuccinylase n=1 Tax=Clostridium collagenovorans DSM 3089 TaxID=1121306 RepID=A0A1M5XVH5_9CLOT|nr:dipeptidase PepV [Clostridium collagenovorans]SHI03845.1 succinyl-diaminopimelate desuccinylase [Clostridium collagenovorans DSM 3089]